MFRAVASVIGGVDVIGFAQHQVGLLIALMGKRRGEAQHPAVVAIGHIQVARGIHQQPDGMAQAVLRRLIDVAGMVITESGGQIGLSDDDIGGRAGYQFAHVAEARGRDGYWGRRRRGGVYRPCCRSRRRRRRSCR